MIYLDHAAATPVNPNALSSMLPYFAEQFFNPSAPYLPAKRVREDYGAAKSAIAHAIGAKGTDLIITAGATESINLAFTVATDFDPATPHILTLATEHTAVLSAAEPYGRTLIGVDRTGLIDLADFRAKLSDDIILVSVSLANNELGTIQPLAEIAEIIRRTRQDRLARGITTPLYLHSDASQALSLLDINVSRLGVDLLTLNAAKCDGPKGVGALYVAHGVPVRPLSLGGGQERGLRSGTENVPGVIGFASAVTDAKKHLNGNRKKYTEMVESLKKELLDGGFLVSTRLCEATEKETGGASLTSARSCEATAELERSRPVTTGATSEDRVEAKEAPQIVFLGNPKHHLANFLPLSFPGVDAERLIYKLEEQGILVSTGAACAANKATKSHVLTAIGLSDTEIAGSLRISLGSTNTLDQMPIVAHALIEAVQAEIARQNH